MHKEWVLNRTTILEQTGHIEIQLVQHLVEDDESRTVLPTSHRLALEPGADIDAIQDPLIQPVIPRIKEVAAQKWTPEVVDKHRAKVAEQEERFRRKK